MMVVVGVGVGGWGGGGGGGWGVGGGGVIATFDCCWLCLQPYAVYSWQLKLQAANMDGARMI